MVGCGCGAKIALRHFSAVSDLLCFQEIPRCFLVDADIVVPKFWKDRPFGGVQSQMLACTIWHVAIDTVLSEPLAKLFTHSAALGFMALQATLGEQRDVRSFELMGVMAVNARHFGVDKTLASFQPRQLIAGVNTVSGRGIVRFVVLRDFVAWTKLIRQVFQRSRTGVALTANLQLFFSR